MNGRLLIVDDERSMCEMLHEDLSERGCEVEWRTKAEEAFALFMREPFDTVITDLKMPGLDGIAFCHRLAENRPDVPVIVITAFGSLSTAVEAIRAGAYDFVTKPVEMDMLAISVERALNHRALREQVRFLREESGHGTGFHEFVGESPVMESLFDKIRRVADQQVPVLVVGESGTGKELVARALHRHGPRRDKPFVPLNCAALPDTLLESELFGHAPGAFTDAKSSRKGLFQEADGGTLFLDEIGEIPLPLQPKLLRALDTGRIRPLGADREVPCDVRLIAATNRDLEEAVEQGRFREDLYYRINVVRLKTPPLRSRGGDILLLAQHFLHRIAARGDRKVRGLSPQVAEKLLGYRWPGNVRELRNAMERAVAMTRFDELAVDDLPECIRDYRESRMILGGGNPDELLSLEEVERRYIEHVLASVNGNKSQAARILGVDRKTLQRKQERWES